MATETKQENTQRIWAIRLMATAEIESGVPGKQDKALQIAQKVFNEYMSPEDKLKFEASKSAAAPIQHRFGDTPADGKSVGRAIVTAMRFIADQIESEIDQFEKGGEPSEVVEGLQIMLDNDGPDPGTISSDEEENRDAVAGDAQGEGVARVDEAVEGDKVDEEE